MDNFKMLSFTNGKHGSNHHGGEKLAWWPSPQLQTKYKFEGIFKRGRLFSKWELWLA